MSVFLFLEKISILIRRRLTWTRAYGKVSSSRDAKVSLYNQCVYKRVLIWDQPRSDADCLNIKPSVYCSNFLPMKGNTHIIAYNARWTMSKKNSKIVPSVAAHLLYMLVHPPYQTHHVSTSSNPLLSDSSPHLEQRSHPNHDSILVLTHFVQSRSHPTPTAHLVTELDQRLRESQR